MINLLDFLAPTDGEDTSVQGTPSDLVESAYDEVEAQEQADTQEEVQTPEPINEIDLDGEKLTLEQIRELKKGNLRQSDYTKKTQELANYKKEHSEALEFYEYFKKNPELLSKLADAEKELGIKGADYAQKLDPVRQELNDLKQQMVMNTINTQLEAIMSKDKTVSDVDLLNIANQYNVPIDTAYNIYRGQNFEKYTQSIKQEAKKEVGEKLKSNADMTNSAIAKGDGSNVKGNFGLTPVEMAFAKKVGMSAEDYAKYKKSDQW